MSVEGGIEPWNLGSQISSSRVSPIINVIYEEYSCAERRYAECRYTEWRGAATNCSRTQLTNNKRKLVLAI